MKLYRSYMFRGKDPVIGELRAMIEGRSLREVEKAGGPSTSCMNAWFKGKTKRPQNATVEAAGRAIGFERVWMRKK